MMAWKRSACSSIARVPRLQLSAGQDFSAEAKDGLIGLDGFIVLIPFSGFEDFIGLRGFFGLNPLIVSAPDYGLWIRELTGLSGLTGVSGFIVVRPCDESGELIGLR